MKFLTILLLISSAFAAEKSANASDKKKVALLPQWHLRAKQKILDLNEARKLPQYSNQLSIYLVIKEWVEEKRVDVVVAEGCEGEITKDTNLNFNGWNYWSLFGRKDLDDYQDIMTHIPLKIEAKYQDKVKTICGDSLELIKKHQLILSDMTGATGYLYRLKQYREKGDTKSFERYKKSYEGLVKKKLKYPIAFIDKKLKELEKQEKQMLIERNKKFVEVINYSKANKFAIVLGARHMKDLEQRLKDAGHEVMKFPVIEKTLPNKGDL